MPIRDQLPPILRGEELADPTPETLVRLDDLAHEALTSGELAKVRDECAARLRQAGASLGVEFLLAAACARLGEAERSLQTLLALGDKLAAAKRWDALADVAERALSLEETQAGARLLVQAHEGLGKDPARVDALQRAWLLIPEDLELGLLLAVRLGEAGRLAERRAMLAQLMPRFAAEQRYAGLEEAALEFAEHDDHDGLVQLVETLPAVGEQGAHAEMAQLFDIAFPPLARAGRAGEALPPLRSILAHAGEKALERWRAALVECLRQGPGRELPDADAVLAAARVADPAQPLLGGLERFDAIAALPPGRAVHHSSFGAGRVAGNDGDTVLIDFAHARGHKMPIAAARRTLSALAEDDLRLLAVADPKALDTMRADQPAEVLVRALRALGGEADATKLKVFLVGTQLVPAKDWNAFWRKAKGAAGKDPRIDSSRAFEQQFRLAPAGAAAVADDGAPLPNLEMRKPVKTNLSTLKKFLAQHPHADAALAPRFGRYLLRVLHDADADRVDRARALLYVSRWYPDRTGEWANVLPELWEQGLSVTDLSGEDEQIALLAASHAAGVESDAILSALDSRFATVRAEAERLRAQLDAHGREVLVRTLLAHAARYPGAAVRQIEDELERPLEDHQAWRTFLAALALVEERPKPSIADKVLRWLEPEGAFDRILDGRPCSEEDRLRIRVLLRQWRSSDRFLFPALEAIDRLGLAPEAEAARAAREQKTARMFDGVGQMAEETELSVMTRATFERLRHELERMERELRTTIPQTIRKARELGDLKENAEYHSAKLKQANVSKMVAALQKRLARARFIDDLEHREGVAGVGTEVVLEADGERAIYWILGEEEHHHGAQVVSFQAPVGRALVGRTVGEAVEIGEGDRRRRWVVVSVTRKLPAPESAPEATST